ncbi:hypothetical protein [Lacticaseibacillus zhaodongensis]|uniref:hypothetical protein n=1 Tax=Lacticaseibacillus zhaodongensis TaxID=2668065 RepID=UPI0012D338D2|nr:hypothetical protein [Lacticaseibacillus zhaodongensis]
MKILHPHGPHHHGLAIAATLAAALAVAPTAIGCVTAHAYLYVNEIPEQDKYLATPEQLQALNIDFTTYRTLMTRVSLYNNQLATTHTAAGSSTRTQLEQAIIQLNNFLAQSEPNNPSTSPGKATADRIIQQGDAARNADAEASQKKYHDTASELNRAKACINQAYMVAYEFIDQLSPGQKQSPEYAAFITKFQQVVENRKQAAPYYKTVAQAIADADELRNLEVAALNTPPIGTAKVATTPISSAKTTLQATISTAETYLQQTPTATSAPEYKTFADALSAAKGVADTADEATLQKLNQTLADALQALKDGVAAAASKQSDEQKEANVYARAAVKRTKAILKPTTMADRSTPEYQALSKVIADCEKAITNQQVHDLATAKDWDAKLRAAVQAFQNRGTSAPADQIDREQIAKDWSTKLSAVFQTLKTEVADAQAKKTAQEQAKAAEQKAAVAFTQNALTVASAYYQQTPVDSHYAQDYQNLGQQITTCAQAIANKQISDMTAAKTLVTQLNASVQTLKTSVSKLQTELAAQQEAARVEQKMAVAYTTNAITIASAYLKQAAATNQTTMEYQQLNAQITACEQAITNQQITDMTMAKAWAAKLNDSVQILQSSIVKTKAEQEAAAQAAKQAATNYTRTMVSLAQAFQNRAPSSPEFATDINAVQQQLDACGAALANQQITDITTAQAWTSRLNTAVQTLQRHIAQAAAAQTTEPATTSSTPEDASALNALHTLTPDVGFLLGIIQEQHLSTTQNLPEYGNLLQAYARAESELKTPGSSGEALPQLLSELQAARKALRQALLTSTLAAFRAQQPVVAPPFDKPTGTGSTTPVQTTAEINASPLTLTAATDQHIPTTGTKQPDIAPSTMIGTATIKYVAGYGVQVWTRQGKLVRNPNGTAKKLRNGSKWHCFGKIIYIGKTKLYNLGGDQYVDAAYVNFAAK